MKIGEITHCMMIKYPIYDSPYDSIILLFFFSSKTLVLPFSEMKKKWAFRADRTTTNTRQNHRQTPSPQTTRHLAVVEASPRWRHRTPEERHPHRLCPTQT